MSDNPLTTTTSLLPSLTDAEQDKFEQALKILHTSNSRDSTKGHQLIESFKEIFHYKLSVAHITETKQVSNRFQEQSKHSAPYTIFYFDDYL